MGHRQRLIAKLLPMTPVIESDRASKYRPVRPSGKLLLLVGTVGTWYPLGSLLAGHVSTCHIPNQNVVWVARCKEQTETGKSSALQTRQAGARPGPCVSLI